MNYGIVDLGSNTVRLSLYRVLPEGDYDLLFSKKEMAGLVNYISGRRALTGGYPPCLLDPGKISGAAVALRGGEFLYICHRIAAQHPKL